MGFPSSLILSRVRCVAWFADGSVLDPVVLDGKTFPVSLHTSRNYGCVPFRPCECHQGIFVAPSADHGVRIWRPSSRHSNLARKIAGGTPHSIDGQGPKPRLKCGTGRWINLNAKDTKDHGYLANVGDQRLATKRLSIPPDCIASPLHRVVRLPIVRHDCDPSPRRLAYTCSGSACVKYSTVKSVLPSGLRRADTGKFGDTSHFGIIHC